MNNPAIERIIKGLGCSCVDQGCKCSACMEAIQVIAHIEELERKSHCVTCQCDKLHSAPFAVKGDGTPLMSNGSPSRSWHKHTDKNV